MKGHGLSWGAILIVLIAGIYVDLNLGLWRYKDRVIEWDIHSYYAYLPAVFIYNDIQLKDHDEATDGEFFLFWPTTTESGARVIKTTMGLSVLYAPFFFLGHGYASLFGYPLNGWSVPYKASLLIGGLCYLVIGLFFIRKILERSGCNDRTIAATIILVGLGTNLFCYSTHSGAMSHVYSFALIALFLHLTMRWFEKPGVWLALQLGLLVGLISLVRPTNALIVVFFLLVGVSNWDDLTGKVRFLTKHWGKHLLIGSIAGLVWVPQLAYWKYITGNILFNPYIGEWFFWSKPHIVDGLFGFRKGWYIYTPIMLIATVGVFLLRNELGKYKVAIITFLCLNIYVTFSWWCWWYGGSYGQRSMVDSYALMAIPLAAVVDRWMDRRLWMKVMGAALGLFLIWLNVFQTYQLEVHSLHYDSMSRELYFKQFGRMECIPGYDGYLDPADYEKAKMGK